MLPVSCGKRRIFHCHICAEASTTRKIRFSGVKMLPDSPTMMGHVSGAMLSRRWPCYPVSVGKDGVAAAGRAWETLLWMWQGLEALTIQRSLWNGALKWSKGIGFPLLASHFGLVFFVRSEGISIGIMQNGCVFLWCLSRAVVQSCHRVPLMIITMPLHGIPVLGQALDKHGLWISCLSSISP